MDFLNNLVEGVKEFFSNLGTAFSGVGTSLSNTFSGLFGGGSSPAATVAAAPVPEPANAPDFTPPSVAMQPRPAPVEDRNPPPAPSAQANFSTAATHHGQFVARPQTLDPIAQAVQGGVRQILGVFSPQNLGGHFANAATRAYGVHVQSLQTDFRAGIQHRLSQEMVRFNVRHGGNGLMR